MNWLIYLVEANAYLVAFYLVYNLLLARETHYQLNRAYLILSSIAAFVLPLMQLNFLKPTVYVYVSNEAYVPVTSATPLWQIVLFYGYLAGVCIVLALFILKLMQLKRLTRSNVKVKRADHQLIRLKESNTAFSFFNYLFIGSNVADEKLVINHELVHIHQKHSADVIFIELLKAINWFNPVIYMLQNSIRTVHEYIADEQTAQSANNTMAYASFLVDNAYGQVGPAITHSFFNHNLLKKRIIMLDQKRSGKLARLKYLVAVPLCAALLGESTLGFSKSYGVISIGQQKIEVDTAKKAKARSVRLAPPPPLERRTGKHLPLPPTPPRDPKTGKVRIDPRAPRPNVSKVKFPPPVPPVKKTASTTPVPVNETVNKIKSELNEIESNLQHNKPQGSLSKTAKPIPTLGVITAKINGTDKQFVIHGEFATKPVQRTDEGIRIEEPTIKPSGSAKPTGTEIRIEDPVVKPSKTDRTDIRIE